VRTALKTVYLSYKKSYTVRYVTDGASDRLTGWKSSNTKVATVTKSGKITAKKKSGTTKITARTQNGKKLTVTVKVVKKAVKLKKLRVTAPATLKVGKSYRMKLKLAPVKATNVSGVTFKSSKKSVLTVDKAGKLVALKKGKATITVKAGGKKYVKVVRVK
jgi:uncharacterized protein YjdB